MTLEMFGVWGPVLLALVMFAIVFGLGVTVGDSIASKRWVKWYKEIVQTSDEILVDYSEISIEYNDLLGEYTRLVDLSSAIFEVEDDEAKYDEALDKLYNYLTVEEVDDEHDYSN